METGNRGGRFGLGRRTPEHEAFYRRQVLVDPDKDAQDVLHDENSIYLISRTRYVRANID